MPKWSLCLVRDDILIPMSFFLCLKASSNTPTDLKIIKYLYKQCASSSDKMSVRLFLEIFFNSRGLLDAY